MNTLNNIKILTLTALAIQMQLSAGDLLNIEVDTGDSAIVSATITGYVRKIGGGILHLEGENPGSGMNYLSSLEINEGSVAIAGTAQLNPNEHGNLIFSSSSSVPSLYAGVTTKMGTLSFSSTGGGHIKATGTGDITIGSAALTGNTLHTDSNWSDQADVNNPSFTYAAEPYKVVITSLTTDAAYNSGSIFLNHNPLQISGSTGDGAINKQGPGYMHIPNALGSTGILTANAGRVVLGASGVLPVASAAHAISGNAVLALASSGVADAVQATNFTGTSTFQIADGVTAGSVSGALSFASGTTAHIMDTTPGGVDIRDRSNGKSGSVTFHSGARILFENGTNWVTPFSVVS